MKRHWRVIVPALITAAILAFVLRGVDLAAMGGAFVRLPPWRLAAAMATVMAVNAAGALRWWFLIPGARFSRILLSYLGSRFFLLAPGGAIVSDASRLMLAAGDSGGYQAAASAVLVDKLTSAVPMLVYCIIGMALGGPRMPAPVWLVVAGMLALELLMLAAGMGGALGPVSRWLRFLARFRLGRVVLDQLDSLAGAFAALRGQPRRFACHVAAGFVNDVGLIAVTAIVGGALASHIGICGWMSVSTLASFAMFLPVTVAGVGLREGAFAATLGLMSVGAPVALAISLIISGLNIMGNLMGGALYLALRGRISAASSTEGGPVQPREDGNEHAD